MLLTSLKAYKNHEGEPLSIYKFHHTGNALAAYYKNNHTPETNGQGGWGKICLLASKYRSKRNALKEKTNVTWPQRHRLGPSL